MRLLGMSARILTSSQRRSGWRGQEDCGVVDEPVRESASRDRGHRRWVLGHGDLVDPVHARRAR